MDKQRIKNTILHGVVGENIGSRVYRMKKEEITRKYGIVMFPCDQKISKKSFNIVSNLGSDTNIETIDDVVMCLANKDMYYKTKSPIHQLHLDTITFLIYNKYEDSFDILNNMKNLCKKEQKLYTKACIISNLFMDYKFKTCVTPPCIIERLSSGEDFKITEENLWFIAFFSFCITFGNLYFAISDAISHGIETKLVGRLCGEFVGATGLKMKTFWRNNVVQDCKEKMKYF